MCAPQSVRSGVLKEVSEKKITEMGLNAKLGRSRINYCITQNEACLDD
jgi:hypothetical protein